MSNQDTSVDTAVARYRRFMAFLAIFLVLIGQFLVFVQPVREGVVVPPYLWLSLLGIILFLLSQVLPPARAIQRIFHHFTFSGAVPWISAAVFLSALTIAMTIGFQRNAQFSYIPVITIWFLAGLCYITAFLNGFVTGSQWKEWFRQNRNELLIIAAITLAAALLRFYNLGEIPRVMDGDEGRLGLIAQVTVESELSNPFALWENFGALYLQAMNLVLRLFGTTLYAVRFLPAVSGVLAVPALYLLARYIAGRRVALIAAILLAISHTHIHFSRIGSVGYIHASWLVPLELYFLLSGLDKRSSWRTAIAGILLAIHFSVYLTAQIITGMLIIYMLLALLLLRSWFLPALRQAAVFWGGFLIMLLPQLYFILRNPNEFFNRLSENGTFQTGWLAETMTTTGQSAVQVLIGRVAHAFLSLIYYPSIDFYGSPSPTLGLIAAVLFMFGLGLALWLTRSPKFLLLNGYFWAATVSIGIFAIPPSADTYRMLIALPPAMILAALGLDVILTRLGMGWSTSRNAYAAASGVVIATLLVSNLWTYYGDFAGQCRYGDNFQGRFASYLGRYVASIEKESAIYLLSDPLYFYGSHASVDFLSQRRPIINVPEAADTLNLVSGETVIASPERIPELETWVRAHPGGDVHYQYDCTRTILMAYQLP